MTNEQDEAIDVTEEPKGTALAVAAPSGMMTLGAGGGLLPSIEKMEVALAEYDAGRKFFLQWLKDHFRPGVHYGVPPGCEPRAADSDQWRNKPSLYDSGARKFIDLYGIRCVYESDLGAWEMMGKKSGAFCRRCKLLRSDGSIAGEGTGIFEVGEKKMGSNSSVKMADKRARVAAVLDAFPFARELFTQDLEDIGTPVDKLTEWVQVQRTDFEAELSTVEFLTKVAAICLYGKTTISNGAEVKQIEDALKRGTFDWRTGERLAVPSATPATAPQEPPQPRKSPTVASASVTTFMARVAKRRAECGSSLDDAGFVATVLEGELGLSAPTLAELTTDQFQQIGQSLKAGKYDWTTGDRLPPVAV